MAKDENTEGTEKKVAPVFGYPPIDPRWWFEASLTTFDTHETDPLVPEGYIVQNNYSALRNFGHRAYYPNPEAAEKAARKLLELAQKMREQKK